MTDTKRSPRVRPNGAGTVYKMPNGKWRAEVTLGWEEREGKPPKRIVRTKSGFKLKREAVAALSGLYDAPMSVDPGVSFKALYDLWSASHYKTITKDTEYCYVAAYAQCRALYHKPFCALKTHDLQSVVDACPHGRRTKQNIKAMLTCMYRYANENDYLDKNYAQYIKLPPKQQSTKDAFTADERKKLWQDYEAGNAFTGYILLMIYTGMRYGEISTIRIENVNLPERYMIGGIKTEKGRSRRIPICEKVYPIVAQLIEAGGEKLLDMHEKSFYTRFSDALVRLNIRPLSPHCCRHTCATALAEAGVQPAIIQQIMGHEDYSTTMQYTHIQTDAMMEAINRIE